MNTNSSSFIVAARVSSSGKCEGKSAEKSKRESEGIGRERGGGAKERETGERKGGVVAMLRK